MTLFTGLSAFPLTPISDDTIDATALIALVERLATSGVDSITALGSTGSYAYLTPKERALVARLVVEHAGTTPVFVGVGALRTSHVLENIDSAEEAGAAGVLLAPMTYQPLTDEDVFQLFRAATEHSRLPVIVYDNPGTTHFHFSTDLYSRIAQLPNIASIKIPPVPKDPSKALDHVAAIREGIPQQVTIGVSGDAFAATGMNAGCDAWYSVIGGTLPGPALTITRAAQGGRAADAAEESERLGPLWDLFTEAGGSLRVIAALAEHLQLVPRGSLPLPIQGLTPNQRTRVAYVADALGFTR